LKGSFKRGSRCPAPPPGAAALDKRFEEAGRSHYFVTPRQDSGKTFLPDTLYAA